MRSNVLFITTDQQRHDLAGYASPGMRALGLSPAIDRMAGRGCVFENAFCTTPLCVPSRTTFYTGQYARRHGVTDNAPRLDASRTPLTEILREHGYQLALSGKNHVFTDDYLRGWDFAEVYDLHGKVPLDFCSPPTAAEKEIRKWRQTAIPHFEAPVHAAEPFPVGDCPPFQIVEHALRFLRGRDRSRPFFLHVSFEAPHFPYVAPEPWFSKFPLEKMPGGDAGSPKFEDKPDRLWMQYHGLDMDRMDDRDIRRVQATYLGMISQLDDALQRLFRYLEEENLLDETLTTFCSDHGDFWGRYGLVGKTNALYDCLLRIPLFMAGPGIKAGIQSPGFVDNSDWMPTVLEMLELPVPAQCQGKSFKALLDGATEQHRACIIAENSHGQPARENLMEDIKQRSLLREKEGEGWFIPRLAGETRSIREMEWKYLEDVSGYEELYHLENDPGEYRNLAGDAQYAAIRKSMQNKLNQSSLA